MLRKLTGEPSEHPACEVDVCSVGFAFVGQSHCKRLLADSYRAVLLFSTHRWLSFTPEGCEPTFSTDLAVRSLSGWVSYELHDLETFQGGPFVSVRSRAAEFQSRWSAGAERRDDAARLIFEQQEIVDVGFICEPREVDSDRAVG